MNHHELICHELLRTIRVIRIAAATIRPWRSYNRGYRRGAIDTASLIEFNLTEKLQVANVLSSKGDLKELS